MQSRGETTEPIDSLAPGFSELGRFLLLAADSGSSMDPQRIVDVAMRAIPHAAHCAVTLSSPSMRPRTIAWTDQLPLRVDALQYDTGQGPCLDALDKDDVVLVDNLARDARWPAFVARCTAQTPVRSMLGVRLRLEGPDRAALNLYATQEGRFGPLDLGVASMLAPFVALSVQSAVNQERVGQLHTALETSRQIGTAMGILMARELVTSQEAFALLRQASQHLNRKLRDIAAEVELTGTLPPFVRKDPA